MKGPEEMYFGGAHPLTKELAESYMVDQVRREFYQKGELPRKLTGEQERRFNIPEFGIAKLESIPNLFPFNNDRFLNPHIFDFLGSVDYAVYQLPSGRGGFWVSNRTDLESGTHFAERFPPKYNQSLEELVAQNPQVAKMPLAKILKENNGYNVISILKRKSREETRAPEGGGTMWQIFTWSEHRLDECQQRLPWPVYRLFLDIHEWPDFRKYTGN